MLNSFSEGKTHEGEHLAQQLVLSGPYPEIVHARLVSVISLLQRNALILLSKCAIRPGFRD